MTREDLLGYGYVSENGKTGEIFFKDVFVCEINEDRSVDFSCCSVDLTLQKVVNSLHELGLAEKDCYEKIAVKLSNMADTFYTLAKNYVVPV